jgi:type IV pilus assembly protein PilC
MWRRVSPLRALEKHPKIFDRLYIEMVRAGEIGGILDGVLLRVADQLEGDQDLKRKVKSAMTYPTVVLIIALLAASFMLIFIVPVFAKMFEDLGGTLPLPTQVAMGASDILTSIFGVLIYAALGGGVYGFLRWKKTENGRRSGAGSRSSYRQDRRRHPEGRPRALRPNPRYPKRAGVPILQAIEITAASSGNWVMENALLKSRDAVRQGIQSTSRSRTSRSSRRW